MKTATLRAADIFCNDGYCRPYCSSPCQQAIQNVLGRLRGVVEAYGDPFDKTVTVSYDPREVDLAHIRQALADEGYLADQ